MAGVPNLATPLGIAGRTTRVEFPNRLLLAPMEGITDQVFRDRVIALGGLGAACTEFIRITVSPVPARVIRRHLSRLGPVPVGVQLMASASTYIAESARIAEGCGAAWIDLNFGCPAPVVVGHQAGSALLCKPGLMAEMVAAAVGATGLPVSAKIRAGIDSSEPLALNMRRLAEAGAALITVHGRLRITPYSQPAHWPWISEAVMALRQAGHQIPVIGNGSVETPEDARRMVRDTACDGVMIGRGALADPWVFRRCLGAPEPILAEAQAFALDYADEIRSLRGESAALAKLKQLSRWYRAGGLFDDTDRQELLRLPDLAGVIAFYHRAATRDRKTSA